MTEVPIDQLKGQNPAFALKCFIQGLKMLTRPGLRQFLMIPIAINFVLYSITLAVAYYYVSDLIAEFIPSWLEWLNWLIWPLFFLSFFVICFFSFTLLANLIAAPFYSKLAAKTELILSGTGELETNEPAFIASMASEAKRIAYLLVRALPLLILFVIPVVNVVAPLIWVLFAAWSMALEYMAYPLENKGYLFPEQRQLGKAKRLSSLSLGGLVMAGLSIPFINIVIPPASVIAATIYFHDLKK